MGRRVRVMVAGHVTHDRYGEHITAGGCAYFGARAYRAFGADVRLVTAVGEDFQRDDALEGLAVECRRAGRTTTFSNHYPDDGPRLQLVEEVAPPVEPVEPSAAVDLLHLAPVLGEISLPRWRARGHTRMLGISVQGWIKGPGAPVDHASGGSRVVVQRPWRPDPGDLQGIGAACLSEEDLIDQGDLLDRLREVIPIVAVTHGAQGAELFFEGQHARIGVYPTRVQDPTGAGDAFAAGFLWRLVGGDHPLAAARFGAAAGSIVVEAEGDGAVHRLQEAHERAAAIPIVP